ncbi:hypothetical protein CIB84_017755, partial [Bambusicola thoracicus]
QPPAPTRSLPAPPAPPAPPARSCQCLPTALQDLTTPALVLLVRQHPAGPATPRCLSSVSSPACQQLSKVAPAHVHLRSGTHVSSAEDVVGGDGHQLGAHAPPQPPRHQHPHGVPGSGGAAAQEAAPHCKAGPRAPRVGPEDNVVGAVRQPQVLRAAPAPRPDQRRRGPRGLPLCLHAGHNPGSGGGPTLEADPQWGVALQLPAAGPEEAVGAGPGSGDQPGHEAAPGPNIAEDVPAASREDG